MPGYRTWATNDIPSAADWNELHSDPLSADVTAAQSTSSTGYVNLATTGPQVTKTLVNGQKVEVTVSARIDCPASLDEGFASFEVTGASTLAAADDNAARVVSTSSSGQIAAVSSRTTVFTATASGSHTFTMKYRTTGGSFAFRSRRIIVKAS